MLRAALQGRSRSTASALRALAHTQPPGAAAGSEDGERGYGEPASEPPAVPWVRSVISGGASLAQPRLASARSPSLPVELLRSPVYNKGMAFSEAERSNLFLRGLLPPFIMTQQQQVARVMTNVRSLGSDLERHTHLVALQERNQRLFYATLVAHPEELKPIIYSPTVGLACQRFGLLFRRPRGLFVSSADRGRVYQLLKNWPERQVRLLCLTDGERVLGLGDLGAHSMGVAASKAVCATAFGGVDPAAALPLVLDVGTDNEALLADPFYVGLRQRRDRGEGYDELLDETVAAAKRRWGPTLVLQFEEFSNQNGLRLLNRYRGDSLCFSDDLQGGAASMLAGVLAALPLLRPGGLGAQTFLFAGAGETGAAWADLLAAAVSRATRLPLTEARKRIWLFDAHGLVTRHRAEGLEPHKLPWAHAGAPPEGVATLAGAVRALRPTCLVGVRRHGFSYAAPSALAGPGGGPGGLFTPEEHAAPHRPLVMALSRPLAHSECTAQEAHDHTGGRAVYASGCLHAPVLAPRAPSAGAPAVALSHPQASTSCFIFPGLALGLLVSGARHLRDDALLVAAEALAARVGDADRARGALYPPFACVREVSAHVARAVAASVYDAGLASAHPRPRDLLAEVRAWQWQPGYKRYAGM